MKLRNKKTGEIGNLPPYGGKDGKIWVCIGNISRPEYRYNSLAELNEEWEDYEEPKGHWTIDPMNESCIDDGKYTAPDELERYEELGLKFETREEAEQAVEKLKAWKRLKDRKFGFYGYQFYDILSGVLNIKAEFENDSDNQIVEDLNLLFGGEE